MKVNKTENYELVDLKNKYRRYTFSAIYAIYCTGNNKMYVGSTKHLNKRVNSHLSSLRKNTSQMHKLQRAYNKYGESSLHFIILERAPIDKLLEVEMHYINKFKSCNEMNILPKAGTREGYRMPAAIKKKISIAKKLQCQDPLFKKRMSEVNMGNKNHSKPVVQYTLNKEFIKEWKEGKEAALELEINYKGINNNLRNLSMSSGGFIWMYKN